MSPRPWPLALCLFMCACDATFEAHTSGFSTQEPKPKAGAGDEADARMKESTRKQEIYLQEQRDIHQAILDKTAVDDWNDRAVEKCKETGDSVMKMHPNATAEQVDDAKSRCARGATGARQSAMAQAQVRCVLAILESGGRAAPSCAPTKLSGADEAAWAIARAECDRSCAAESKSKLEEAKRAGEFRARRVKCCDGTRSAHCTYNNMDDLGGVCCLRHGGNCVENE